MNNKLSGGHETDRASLNDLKKKIQNPFWKKKCQFVTLFVRDGERSLNHCSDRLC